MRGSRGSVLARLLGEDHDDIAEVHLVALPGSSSRPLLAAKPSAGLGVNHQLSGKVLERVSGHEPLKYVQRRLGLLQ